MKKTILFMSMAAAFLFAGCQKEQSAKTLTLTASIEQQQEVNKTYLNGGYVLWSEKDSINVFTDQSENVKLTLKSGVGSTTGSFSTTTEVTGTPTYAIYPYAAGNTISGSTITFNLPATQKYVPNTFDNGANVAVAQVTGNGMQFKNVCGVLKLQLTGNGKVKKIELTGNNDEYLWGTYTADANTASSNAAIYSTGGGKVLTLDCSEYNETTPGARDGGIFLSLTTTTSFYLVVPAGVFGNETKGGFKAIVYASVTSEFSTDDKSNVINRSKLRAMPIVKIGTDLPSDYVQQDFIQSFGGEYFDTGIFPTSNTGCFVDFQYTYLPTSHANPCILGVYYVGAIFRVSYTCYTLPHQFIHNNGFSFSDESDPYARIQAQTDGSYQATSPYSVYLFAQNEAGKALQKANCKLYSCIISENDVIVRNYVPARQISTNKYGMFDIISQTFNLSLEGQFGGSE